MVRIVVMRQRCTRQALKDAPVQPARVHTNTVPFSSFFGSRVSGPQLSAVFIMQAPAKYPGHPDFKAPPPAELDVEVGPASSYGCTTAVHACPGCQAAAFPHDPLWGVHHVHNLSQPIDSLSFSAHLVLLSVVRLQIFQLLHHAGCCSIVKQPLVVALQVGQILFHGRISKSNRMLPFTTQIIEVVSAHYPPNLPTPGDAVAAAVEEAASPRSAAPVADPDTGHAQVDSNNAQLAQQTAFPGLQVSLSHAFTSFHTLGRAHDETTTCWFVCTDKEMLQSPGICSIDHAVNSSSTAVC